MSQNTTHNGIHVPSQGVHLPPKEHNNGIHIPPPPPQVGALHIPPPDASIQGAGALIPSTSVSTRYADWLVGKTIPIAEFFTIPLLILVVILGFSHVKAKRRKKSQERRIQQMNKKIRDNDSKGIDSRLKRARS